jgi:hypothetical protein
MTVLKKVPHLVAPSQKFKLGLHLGGLPEVSFLYSPTSLLH